MVRLIELPAGSALPLPVAQARRGRAATTNRWGRASCRLLKEKARTLFGHFPAAFGGDEEAVHQLRVESRRLRVAVSLVSDNPGGRRTKRARRLLQQLTRTAGSSRDLDVLFEIYDERLQALPTRTPEQACLRKRLADARRRGRRRMVEALLDVEVSQLRADLRELVARGGSPISVVDERVNELAQSEGQPLQEGLDALGALLDPVALHALRRRARRLRYGVDVIQAIAEENRGASKPWKMLQDLIGSIHDRHVLAEWLEAQAAADRKRGNHPMAAAAVADASWARSTMVRLHDEFIAARPHAIVAHGLSLIRQLPQRDPQ
jgi:CHAD domain-containing protein